MNKFQEFLKRKNIVFSGKRYGIDALGAMAQGLFCSLLIGTIIRTLGSQLKIPFLVDIGTYAMAVSGPAMAVAIGYALQAPPMVLFSLAAVGWASNAEGGAGGPLAVLIIAIIAAEFGKAVSKESEPENEVSTPLVIKTKEADETSNARRVSGATRVVFLLLSLFISLFLWLYIQIDNNPVVSRSISVPISYPEEQNYRVSFPIDEVELNIVGRRNTINSLTSKDIVVTIDYASLPDSKEGIVEVPVVVTSKDKNVYFRVERRFPQTVKVVKFRSQS